MKPRNTLPYKFILLIGAIFVLSLVSFAWFYTEKGLNTEEMQSLVEDANRLQISTDGGQTWATEKSVSIKKDFTLEPVIGDGSKFWYSGISYSEAVSGNERMKILGTRNFYPLSSDAEIYSKYVYQQDFRIKTENERKLYISPESTVFPGPHSVNSALLDGNGKNISAGYICSAARVAFYVYESGAWKLKSIWIPNATTRLEGDKSTGLSLNTDAEPEEKFTFVSSGSKDSRTGEWTFKGTEISTEGNKSGTVTKNGTIYAWGEIEGNTVLLTTIAKNSSAQLRIKIWIDGTDEECNNVFQGGSIGYKIYFEEEKK